MNFYPRSPCGERQAADISVKREARLSIHALLAESDDDILAGVNELLISIHALLAESDNTPIKAYNIIKISIHALLAESDEHLLII